MRFQDLFLVLGLNQVPCEWEPGLALPWEKSVTCAVRTLTKKFVLSPSAHSVHDLSLPMAEALWIFFKIQEFLGRGYIKFGLCFFLLDKDVRRHQQPVKMLLNIRGPCRPPTPPETYCAS